MTAITFHISINALRHSSEGWGDLAYAQALAAALGAKGHRAETFFREEDPALTGMRDVVLRIIGPHLEDPVEGVPNLLWIISPPNLAPLYTLGRYQGVFVASPLQTERLSALAAQQALQPAPPELAQPDLPILHYLPQAADTALFRPEAALDQAPLDLVFVGNHAARAPRRNVLEAVNMGFRPAIWGQGWEGHVPADLIRGPRVSSAELAAIYARAKVVMNSHMPHMAQQGFTSNRSYDALACGAAVVSDPVEGALPLDGLLSAATPEALRQILTRLLDQPAPDAGTRRARHAAIHAGFSFAARAETFIRAAETALAAKVHAPYAYRPLSPQQPMQAALSVSASVHPDAAGAADVDPSRLAALVRTGRVELSLRLCDPAATVSDDPQRELVAAARAVARICTILAAKPALGALHLLPPDPVPSGILHAGQADLREAQGLLVAARLDPQRISALAARARRVIEASVPLTGAAPPLRTLIRASRAAPLHAHSPLDATRDRHKRHLALWPRQQQAAPERPIGVFLHLYYDELAADFAQALTALEAPYRLYVSTDTAQKAKRLAQVFPTAEIRILPNRGRDIWPKLYGFGDRYGAHDLVLHLHGKRSPHGAGLAGWRDHILSCLLPRRELLRRLLSLFETVPRLGMICPAAFRPTLAAAHWGDNLDIARELAARMELGAPLPANDRLDFPAGSMFWARTEALRPLLDLALPASAFPPESGEIDGTAAHAIERLYGAVCQQQGFEIVPVAPPDFAGWPAHRLILKRNGDLKQLLARGRFQELDP